MRNVLIGSVVIVLLFVSVAFAVEREFKPFSPAQIEVLKNKVLSRQIAESQLNEFVSYLKKEHGVDDTWQILNDLSGFEKVQPQVAQPTQPKGDKK